MNNYRLGLIAWIGLTLLVVTPLMAEKFVFKYQVGQKYRVISEVKQLYSYAGDSYRTDQLNRAVVNVVKVEGDRAWHEMDYQNSRETQNADQVYQYDRLYKAAFWRDIQGVYTIDPLFFVPPVRDIPVFFDKDLQIGDTWTNTANEVQDLRSLGIIEPFAYTFPVSYEYKGKAEWKGKPYDLIVINYNIFYPIRKVWPQAILSPKIMGGYSHQKMYWDNETGRAVHYDEEYFLMLTFADGHIATWEGTATANIEDIIPFDTANATKDVRKKLDDMKLSNVTVREDKQGVTISIENIQFAPDSADLLASEKAKLDSISKVLAQFADRPLLITGHTALAGTEEGRQVLSEQRAQAVGQYLLDHKVRPRDSLQFQGKGATEALGDNQTDAGRARNRRVEITILKE